MVPQGLTPYTRSFRRDLYGATGDADFPRGFRRNACPLRTSRPDVTLVEHRGPLILNWLEGYSDQAHACIRIAAGSLFWCHGAQKFGLLGGLGGSGASATLFSLLWWAGVIEFIAGPALALGVSTRAVALIVGGEMVFAYFSQHASMAWLPLNNGGELAWLYGLLWLFLLTRGAGPWSVDRAIARRQVAAPRMAE